MKRKIKFELIGITVMAIFLTLLMVCSVFYEIFKKEIISELATDTKLLAVSGFLENGQVIEKEDHPMLENLRITIISPNGSVIYDNYTDTQLMTNHLSRPEVAHAIEKGEGTSIRKSTTLGKATFYYALKQSDGSIIRVARETDSIWAIYMTIMPAILLIAIGLCGICIIVAHYLTKSIVAPIERMACNIEGYSERSIYKELVPFISKIKEQHEDILKSAKMRQEFTANVSHELKTPLTSISGYAEIIENGMAKEEDVKRFAKEIQRNSKRLLNLINDIIKLSELDSNDIQVDFDAIDLFDLAKETVELLQLYSMQHNVALVLSGENCKIRGNKSMLEEMIYNLCDNAIRYNKKGGKVDVTISRAQDKVTLAVRDTGIGISKEHQERIFERFYRVDKSRSKLTGGTGLGLAIVKHIVAQHKAQLEIESEMGQGTTIRIHFPSYYERSVKK